MQCPNCTRENPPNVQFCVYCGTKLPGLAPSPRIEALAPAPPSPLGAGMAPAMRPFGLTFIPVYTLLSSLGWIVAGSLTPLLIPGVAISGAIKNLTKGWTGGPGGTTEATITVLLALANVLLTLIGLLGITAAIGLWLMSNWGRLLTIAILMVDLLFGFLLIIGGLNSNIQLLGFTPVLVLWGILTIGIGGGGIAYLLRLPKDLRFT
jgi:hypothetical protein